MSRYGGDSWSADARNRQKKVKELMGEKVEGEVVKCSNGRYACLVCTQQPVFDTLPMFAIHQRGRKHQAALEERREAMKRTTGTQPSSRKRTRPDHDQSVPGPRPQQVAATTSMSTGQPRPRSRQSNPAPSQHPPTWTTTTQPYPTYVPVFVPPPPFYHGCASYPAVEHYAAYAVPPDVDAYCQHPAVVGTDTTSIQPSGSDAPEEKDQQQSKKRRLEQEYYERLRELGWIRREDGTLEKDPSVEWDSDSDEPPPPPPELELPALVMHPSSRSTPHEKEDKTET